MYTFKNLRRWQTGIIAVALGLLCTFFPALRVKADSGHYYLDFGEPQITTTTGWNNISSTQAKNTTNTIPLKDSTGTSSALGLRFTDAFNCLPGGAPTAAAGTTSSSLYPSTATYDSIFLGTAGAGSACTQTDTTAKFNLSGLAPNVSYTVKFYASRLGDTTNRTTNYTIGSQTASLNATGNVNNTASLTSTASSGGVISVTVSKAAASATYGYLGVVEIVRNNVPPTVNAGPDQAVTLPDHQVNLTGSGSVVGGAITSYAWSEVTPNNATIASPSSASTAITDLAAGTYTFRLTVTDSFGLTASDDVTVVVSPQNTAACAPSKFVVLGSSTAAGSGATPYSNSWVGKYTTYVQQLNAENSVLNMAVAGSNTYEILPAETSRPSNRPASDTAHNITAAIEQNPDAIIVNMPTNDTALSYTLAETQANFETIYNAAATAGIPIWITTSQPRNLDQTGRTKLIQLKDWIQYTYGEKSLDFWSVLANTDGSLKSIYDYGDGVHVNNAAHQKLYSRVAGSNILGTVCQIPPGISDVTSEPVVSQNIHWITNTAASSRVEYGTTTTYGQTTSETDNNPRVTTHTVTIPNLTPCTTYHYRVHSIDVQQTPQTSDDQTFRTLCAEP